MLVFLSRRALQLLLVLLLVSTVLFVLIRMSGDPAIMLAGPNASPETIDAIHASLGLDASLPVQYVKFVGGVMHLDFGTSLTSGASALRVVGQHLPYTALLAATSVLIALCGGLILGVWAAVSRRRFPSALIHGIALFAQSVPAFWLGILLILLFAVQLRWLPSFGTGGISHLVLPAATLATWPLAKTMLLVHGQVEETQKQDFVRTAKAKGISRRRRIWRHVVPNSLTPVVSVIGTDLAELLGGAVIVETVFAWPGIGQLLLQSVSFRDYPVVQATVFVVAILVVVVNMLADLAYRVLDPRLELK